uniref:Direct IAP-binding protein with low pI n=1 Tax=Strigamia maritima TaxID=126957 RepID=T1JIK1_STRMM
MHSILLFYLTLIRYILSLAAQANVNIRNATFIAGIVTAKQSLTNDGDKFASKLNLTSADPDRLTYSFLIKQAASHTVDAATTVLTQTAVAILENEKKYREELRKLIKLMDFHSEAIGQNEDDNSLWDQIVALRSESETIKKKINEMDIFLQSVTQLMSAAAETAYHADCEYGSIAASERLQSVTNELDFSKNKSKDLEKRYLESYSKLIRESGNQKTEEDVAECSPS